MKLTRKGKIVIALFIILVIGSTITIYVKSRLNQFNVNVQEKIGTKEEQKESVDKIKNKNLYQLQFLVLILMKKETKKI